MGSKFNFTGLPSFDGWEPDMSLNKNRLCYTVFIKDVL